jgi:hypothetical protein
MRCGIPDVCARRGRGTRRAFGSAAVPSFSHEILVDLCRQRGDLARALLGVRGIAAEGTRAEIGSIDLSQVAPTEYRADAVTVFWDQDVARTAVIVEVQLQADADKRRSWPVYVAALRAALGCPVYLIVIAPHAAVARWARAPIELGHPGFRLAPLVLALEDLPRVTDPAVARALPELAVLSALGHPEREVAGAALGALEGLPEDRARLYYDLIMAAAPDAVQRYLEKLMMKGYEYQSEFARKYYGQGLQTGRAEGLETGRAEGLETGRAEGLETGRAEGLRAAALEVARAKVADLTPEEAAAIRALHDEALLALISQLASAPGSAEARAVLRAAAVAS